VDSPQRDNGSQTDRKPCVESSRDGRCESTSGEEQRSIDDKPAVSSAASLSPLSVTADAATAVPTVAVLPPLAGGLLQPQRSTSPPLPEVSPLSPRGNTPRTSFASPDPVVVGATSSPPSGTADSRQRPSSSEPLLSVELVSGVVGGGAAAAVLLAAAVAAVCRYRSRERGTYNVDAATVNGYAYEICTTTSSVGTSSTTTIGGTRRKARAVAGTSEASPGGGNGGSGGRKAGKAKKKVVREWYV